MSAMKCYKCQTMFEADPMRDIGTFWQPLYAVYCPKCGAEHQISIQGFDVDAFIEKAVGPEVRKGRFAKPIDARLADDEVLEYWVQQYIAANYKQLGFDALQGPFDVGPDFRVQREGQWIFAEAEVVCKNYVKHKHHENQKWASCAILIVLEGDKPTKDIERLLPPTIIHLDKQQFLEWYEPMAREYAQAREKEWPAKREAAIVNQKMAMLAGEIRKRFGIPGGGEYGDDPGLGALELADDLAFEFAAQWMKRRETDEFKLSDVTPEALNEFCSSVAPRVVPMLPDLGVYSERD